MHIMCTSVSGIDIDVCRKLERCVSAVHVHPSSTSLIQA